jgi:hypothetical protein
MESMRKTALPIQRRRSDVDADQLGVEALIAVGAPEGIRTPDLLIRSSKFTQAEQH